MKRLEKSDFYYTLAGEIGVQLEFVNQKFSTKGLVSSANLEISESQLDSLIFELNDFSNKSSFFKFRLNQIDNYKNWINQLTDSITSPYLCELSTYVMSKKNLIIHLNPLNCWGAYNVLCNDSIYSKENIIINWGFNDINYEGADLQPYFAAEWNLENTLWHEVLHSYVNPWVNNNINKLPIDKIDHIRRSSSIYFEYTPKGALSEYIVRAYVVALTRNLLGDKSANFELEKQLSKFGFDISNLEDRIHLMSNNNRTISGFLNQNFANILDEIQ